MESQDLFGTALGAHAALLEPLLARVRFEKGATLFEAGTPGDCCYLIDEGEVRIEVDREEIDTDGVLAYLGAGKVVGEIALLDRQPRSASAYAHVDVVARRINADDLDRLGESHPEVVLLVMRALARDAAAKLRGTNEKLADAIFPERDAEVEDMVERAVAAQAEFATWPEARVDGLILAVAQAVAVNAGPLAEATVSETHLGNVADKTFKNQVASMGVAQTLIGQPGSGALPTVAGPGITEIAAPVGVVFGLVPQTNPIATAVFKTLICLKSRNAVILSFHHSALGVANQYGEILRSILAQAGAPLDLIQWVKARTSRKKTAAFMAHANVGLILATGGSGMVKAAYSSGTPALGVGPGNAPVLISASANIEHAAYSIAISKSFDNGLICGSEHNLVVEASVRDAFIAALERHGAAVLSDGEAARFSAAIIDPATHGFRPQVIGQTAARIAKVTGITRPFPIRLIVVPATWNGGKNAWAGEKMAPMLSLFTVADADAGIAFARQLLAYMGTGHTSILHAQDEGLISRFAAEMPVSRILVNSPGSHGVVGYTTGLLPSFTLGCGTFGGNSTTDNVSYRNLTNTKRLARFVDPIARGLAAPPPGASLPLPLSAFGGEA
jgi:acetaldehyde dehydrogenase/alcohol dehydrogenase